SGCADSSPASKRGHPPWRAIHCAPSRWWPDPRTCMRYQHLGQSGPLVSVVGLGASHFGRVCDLEQTRAVVDAAIEAGITFIDTAEAYAGSEELLGQVLRGRRQYVVVSSKFGHPWSHPDGGGGTRAVIRTSIEGTLRRLQTDY